MRVLATVNASPSHVRKFIPLVRSLVGAGHDVHFVTSEPMLRELAGEPVTSSTPLPDAYEGLAAFLRGMAAAEQAGASGGTESDDEPDQTANLNMLFGLEFWRQILPVVVDIAKDFKADLVLRDDFDAVGYLVAEQLGIPHLAMSGGSTILLDPSRLADPLAVHGQELGLAGSGRGLYGYGRVDYLPEEYSFTTHRWPVELRFRQPVLNRPGEVLPDWIAGLTPDRPLVYAALGTSLPMQAKLGREGVPLPSTIRPEFEVRQMIDALAELDCHAVVATGGIGACGATPSHVHVVEHVPQPLVLEVADLFLNHGGYNGIRESLRVGVPMVVCPQGGDQPHNARRVNELGVGIGLIDTEPGDVLRACRTVLSDGSYRGAAHLARRRILALPGVETAPQLLQRIVDGEN